LPKAADREIDQARIVTGQVLIADPEAGGDAGPEAFDEDIAIAGEASGDPDAFVVLQIEAQTVLAAIINGRQRRMTSVSCSQVARPVSPGGSTLMTSAP
jgi:hypothetical protein